MEENIMTKQEKSDLLAKFIAYLRTEGDTDPSDTSLIHLISNFLNISFDDAHGSVNKAIGV